VKRSARKTANLSKSLNHQLNSYALAASAAGVSLLALAPLSEGEIVYTKAHIVLPGRSNAIYKLDLNHDGVVDFALSHGYSVTSTRGGAKFFRSGIGVGYLNTPSNGIVQAKGIDNAAALGAGVKVGPSDYFRSLGILANATGPSGGNPSFSGGAWANKGKGLQDRYLGLRFLIQGKLHYGWAPTFLGGHLDLR
jgi:hypothetical protein